MHLSIRTFLGILLLAGPSTVLAKGGVLTGKGTEASPYLIEDYDDLKAINELSLSSVYRLVNDIDASASVDEDSGRGFNPIGGTQPEFGGWDDLPGFSGSIHGGGHTIKNLHIKRWRKFVGLVGYMDTKDSCVIDSLNLVNADILGHSYVGGIASLSEICQSITTPNGPDGIRACSIRYSSFDGRIQAVSVMGGIAGCGTVEHSHSSGVILGSSSEMSEIGGIVGIGTAKASYSISHIAGGGLIGGITGNGSVLSSYFAGTIEGGKGSVGGLAGWAFKIDQSYSRGIIKGGNAIAGNNYGDITNSYSDATIIDSLCRQGGLVDRHYNGAIINSYANLRYICKDTLDKCKQTDECTNGANPAGLANWMIDSDFQIDTASIKSSYWNLSLNPNPSAGKWELADNQVKTIEENPKYVTSKGLTAEELTHAANFKGWDFSETGPWQIDEGSGMPKLRIFSTARFPTKATPSTSARVPFTALHSQNRITVTFNSTEGLPLTISVTRIDGTVVASHELSQPSIGTNTIHIPLQARNSRQLLLVTMKRGNNILATTKTF